ncbi:VOC family protein [Sphingomonas daechungensis]|uniref:VOC family protein n=1 Tax=Sphingomonas daechungensis TaxID=1176646 RepID=UPI003784D33E
MSEVTDAPARADETRRPLQGSNVWYELMTPDPDGARAFYGSVVGWTISDPIGGEQDYRMIGRSDGGSAGGVLGLTDGMRQEGARPIWLGYFGVDDVDATVAAAEEKGGKVLMPAFDIPQGRIAMVADPQGLPFYVMTPIPPEGDPDAQSDVFSLEAEQRVGWNELMTSNPEAARQFYGDLFGWTSDDFMPMGENGEYRFFARSGETFGAVCKEMGSGSSKWRFYIRVPSITKAVEAVKAGGGEVTMGPHEVPGGDHIIIGNDPQGAEFALVGKA